MNGIRIALSGVGLVATAALFTATAAGQGGDTIGTATVIGALPYSDAGTTVGYVDDYDEVCPFTGSTSPDVVYAYTPGVNETVDITLCDYSQYDTKLYVYENAATPGTPFACNDDACVSGAGQSYVSELLGLNFVGGNTYYIVVDGYYGASGDYTIDMTAIGGGCPEATMNVVIFTDNYPGETTWEIVEHGVGVIASGGPYADPATLYEHEVCVNYDSCFDFTIYDAFGDGICCAYGNGYYEVYYEGTLVGTGGEFGASETIFDIGDNCVPATGACCVGPDCVATNTQAECDALGGTWYEGEDCATFMCPVPPECPAYHVSSRVLTGTGENAVFLFDEAGVYTGWSYIQYGGAAGDGWGYRDGCTDRDGHIFFGWGGGLVMQDNDGSNQVQIFPDGGPNGTWRALAFDTTGDGGNGSIWSASFGSDLVEAALDGTILNTYPVDGWSLYGLAYDDVDGNIWGHDAGGAIIKIDTATGLVMPGEGWPTAFANIAAQGGLSGLHDGSGNLAAVSQGTPDELGVYDLTGTLVGGPWDIDAQTGENGALGVAVCLGEGGLVGYFDIKPGSCPNPFNCKSKGVLPTALLGTMDFDVTLVDPASLMIARADGMGGSVAPIRFNYDDVGTPFLGELCDCHALEGDGFMDMTIKFKTQELVSGLMLEGMTGELELVLSGMLMDGTPFTANDCILFVPLNEEDPGDVDK
jgi:hypothetical protein